MSQHDLIFGSLDFDDNPAPMITTYRDYVNFDAATVENAILAIPWSDFFASNEPDLLVNFFNKQVKQTHDACIPLRTKRGSKLQRRRDVEFPRKPHAHLPEAVHRRRLVSNEDELPVGFRPSCNVVGMRTSRLPVGDCSIKIGIQDE
ncbi:hypothetical protein quinque_002457 [Culex quinquefasciatus]